MGFTYHDVDEDPADVDSFESEEEEDEDVAVDYDDEDPDITEVDSDNYSDEYDLEAFPSPPMIPVINNDIVLFVPPEVANGEEIVNDLNLVYNDNMFEFDHQWQKHRQFPHIKAELFELDILPDPRLYGINVPRLRHLARTLCSQCGDSFEATYENYMIHIETTKLKVDMMDHYLVHLDAVVASHVDNLIQRKITSPNPFMFFPAMLNPVCKEKRKREINTALNKFVIRMEVHIEALSWYDALDNVHWGIGNGEPTPKLSWLRFLRWRRYYLHLLLSGISFAPPNDPQMTEGPPNLTSRDIERMALTNCFALCKSSGQFASNSYGCHRAADPADPLPLFPNVLVNDILAYHYKSMWTINLNDFDVETVWVYKGRTLDMESSTNDNKPRLTRRQQRLETYLANRYPEWGRMSSHVMSTGLNDGGIWATDNAAEDFATGWEDERPTKHFNNVSLSSMNCIIV
jgi:hypothetical protein